MRISVYLQNSINTIFEFSECYNYELIDFCNELCADCSDFAEIKERVLDVLIKNKQGSKIPKFTKVYAFAYQGLIDFPQRRFDYETLTANEVFDSVHKIINAKTDLHHSHTTGKIIGYAHDFCNANVREKKYVLTCIAHNFFVFEIYFSIKVIRLSVWGTKDINIGRTGLTNINFACIGNIKFIDTMKYYQTSLGKLASTLNDIKKNRVEVLTKQFLMPNRYFSNTCLMLTEKQKN